jgi:PUA domain protein
MSRILSKFPPDRLKKKQTASISAVQKLKHSALHSMPAFESLESVLFPKKKSPVATYNLEDHVVLHAVGDLPVPIFVQLGSQQVIPHLRLAIDYPGLLRPLYIDDGAVRALLRGADLMAPGIKRIDELFGENSVVEIQLIDTTVPFAIGIALFWSDGINADTKGIAIQVIHILKDGLWEHRERIQA